MLPWSLSAPSHAATQQNSKKATGADSFSGVAGNSAERLQYCEKQSRAWNALTGM